MVHPLSRTEPLPLEHVVLSLHGRSHCPRAVSRQNLCENQTCCVGGLVFHFAFSTSESRLATAAVPADQQDSGGLSGSRAVESGSQTLGYFSVSRTEINRIRKSNLPFFLPL